MDAIDYPVFIRGRNFVGFANDENRLKTCTRYAFNMRYFERMQILDSAGNLYVVEDAVRRGYTRLLSVQTLLLNPWLRVEFKLIKKARLSPEKAKLRVIRACASTVRELDIPKEKRDSIESIQFFPEFLQAMSTLIGR